MKIRERNSFAPVFAVNGSDHILRLFGHSEDPKIALKSQSNRFVAEDKLRRNCITTREVNVVLQLAFAQIKLTTAKREKDGNHGLALPTFQNSRSSLWVLNQEAFFICIVIRRLCKMERCGGIKSSSKQMDLRNYSSQRVNYQEWAGEWVEINIHERCQWLTTLVER